MLPWFSTGRGGRVAFLAAIITSTAFIVWSLWYGMNSDKDDIPAILTQLIPAGHATCQQATLFECSSCLEQQFAPANRTDPDTWTYSYDRDALDEGLAEDQCHAAFPGLFEDVHQGVTHWKTRTPITRDTLDQIKLVNGMTRAMIYEGKLYVIATKSKAEDHRRKTLAALSSIYRALTAIHDRQSLPNIEFVFSIEDKASDVTSSKTHPLWVLARKASERSFFLLPDFGFWAWDNIINKKNHEVGPYDEVVQKAQAVESNLKFSDKNPQLVWRGKLSFAPKLRRALLDVARGQPWSDVKELNWEVESNYLTLDDHCKYMFIAHIEGRSYSASLKYRQACRSVVVAHRLQHIQHHHYLLVSQGEHQNYVQVERDFSDLSAKMDALLADPAEAERIANNSVRTFRERYLTPAAEACYWRALWRGYGAVSEPSKLWHNTISGQRIHRGMRFETFSLLSSDEMLDFKAAGP
jgi:hypothetical protein